MKILYLYNNPTALGLAQWLREKNCVVETNCNIITAKEVIYGQYDLLISYTYSYIVSEDVLKAINYNAINLHISYLPYNRGANPNQWSFIENTPKGVSIHYMAKKLDAGNLIAQKLVLFDESDTLQSSYNKLNKEIVELFKQIFPFYENWKDMQKSVLGKGTYHTKQDYEPIQKAVNNNFQMKISEFVKIALESLK